MTVLLLGGRMRGRTLATVDHWALRMLGDLVIDLAFLGSNGISREHGLTTPTRPSPRSRAPSSSASRRRVFVGLHTKFGASSFCRFAEISRLRGPGHRLRAGPTEATATRVLGPQVVRA